MLSSLSELTVIIAWIQPKLSLRFAGAFVKRGQGNAIRMFVVPFLPVASFKVLKLLQSISASGVDRRMRQYHCHFLSAAVSTDTALRLLVSYFHSGEGFEV